MKMPKKPTQIRRARATLGDHWPTWQCVFSPTQQAQTIELLPPPLLWRRGRCLLCQVPHQRRHHPQRVVLKVHVAPEGHGASPATSSRNRAHAAWDGHAGHGRHVRDGRRASPSGEHALLLRTTHMHCVCVCVGGGQGYVRMCGGRAVTMKPRRWGWAGRPHNRQKGQATPLIACAVRLPAEPSNRQPVREAGRRASAWCEACAEGTQCWHTRTHRGNARQHARLDVVGCGQALPARGGDEWTGRVERVRSPAAPCGGRRGASCVRGQGRARNCQGLCQWCGGERGLPMRQHMQGPSRCGRCRRLSRTLRRDAPSASAVHVTSAAQHAACNSPLHTASPDLPAVEVAVHLPPPAEPLAQHGRRRALPVDQQRAAGRHPCRQRLPPRAVAEGGCRGAGLEAT